MLGRLSQCGIKRRRTPQRDLRQLCVPEGGVHAGRIVQRKLSLPQVRILHDRHTHVRPVIILATLLRPPALGQLSCAEDVKALLLSRSSRWQ